MTPFFLFSNTSNAELWAKAHAHGDFSGYVSNAPGPVGRFEMHCYRYHSAWANAEWHVWLAGWAGFAEPRTDQELVNAR